MLAERRLPGIRVDVAPPPATEALPRMDVAVLVGFAETGPVDLPVAIESVGQFSAVFGGDAPLAWDDTRNERVYAYLGPAVRAFFSNGGRRCWVIRVAREPVANVFAVAGTLVLGADGGIGPAMAQARCEGSWSDDVRVASALEQRSFGIDELRPASSPAGNRLTFRTRFGLRSGDLIELGDEVGDCSYATIDDVRVASETGGPYAVEATVCAAFERLDGIGSPSSPPAAWSGTAQVEGFGPTVPATLLPGKEYTDPARLQFDAPMPAGLERGHWARWFDGGPPVWLRIDEIEREPAFAGSPVAMDSSLTRASATGPAWRELGAVVPFTIAGIRRAHRLSLELRVDGAEQRAERVSGIGLTPTHPAAWWNHLSDADFYRPLEDMGAGRATQAVADEGARFSLARAAERTPLAWIPLGATPLFGPALAPLPQPATKLERDGLAKLDAGLFLDPELAGASMHALPELADSIRFLRPRTRRLTGLHAAWSIGAGGLFNEASLLAIPDAVHLGWHPRDAGDVARPEPPGTGAPAHWHTHRGACAAPTPAPQAEPDFGVFLDCATRALNAPVLHGPDAPVPPGTYRLTWSNSEPGGYYVLFEATQAHFGDQREVYRGTTSEYIALNPREGVYYYQVFARIGDDTSDGSNAVAVLVRSDDWVQNSSVVAERLLESQWLAVHRAALRMAAANGDLFVALAMPRHFRTQQALRYAQRLRTVRQPPGDADLAAFGFTEARALSYGALYFPWLQSDLRASGELGNSAAFGALSPRSPTVVPPDGVAVGVLAARASRRGAWIAAANEPMKDVVALTPAVAALDWEALQAAQINLVRADPRGFLTLSADTLAVETELRPINVRRLLILLRRVALRRGTTYVFEPNGPTLRRAVQRGFELLLTDLFQRGAFAGGTVEQSFRVATDDTINTGRDADAGRFLVELRVAPSVPMRFIGVLLAQSGARLTVREEL